MKSRSAARAPCVILDLDGTLVDSKAAVVAAFAYVLSEFEVDPLDTEVIIELIGGHKICDAFKQALPIAKHDRLRECVSAFRRRYRELELANEVRLFTGVHEALEALTNAGVRLAVLTDRSRQSAETTLVHFGIESRFDALTSASEVSRGKPEPDGVLLLIAMMKCDPKDAVVVGDREEDIQAGNRAGVSTIAVTYGYGRREGLLDAGAKSLVDSLPQLVQVLTTV